MKLEEKFLYHEKGKDSLYKIWHSSDEHLFMYIHSGCGSIVSEEKIFPIKSGVLIFIAANKYHYTLPDNPKEYERSKFVFLPQTLDKIDGIFKSDNTIKKILNSSIVYAQIDESNINDVEQIFVEYNDHKNENGGEFLWLSCLFKLLFLIDKYSVGSVPNSKGVINKAIKYINENISLDINIENVCSAINISKHYFCRQFKQHIGLTVMKYILRTRITLAKTDLVKTNLSVSEISEKNGFSSVSYFCRIFKETEGCTPLQFRKRNTF